MTEKIIHRGYEWEQKETGLSSIRQDRDLQPRQVPLVPKVVRKYADAMKDGAIFPPIQLARIKRSLFILDGHHRVAAARQIGRTSLAAIVTSMSQGEAKLYALGTNTDHGEKLKLVDRRRILAQYVESGFHLRSDGEVKSSRQIEREINKALTHPTITQHLRARDIEPGDPEADGFEPRMPWRHDGGHDGEAEELPTEPELIAQVNEHLHAIELLTDQMELPASVYSAREALAAIARHLWEKARHREGLGSGLLDV